MVCHHFSDWSLRSCKRAVYGFSRGFRVSDQGVVCRFRRRRMHRRCIGCEENTILGCPPRTRPQVMNQEPINQPSKVHFLVRPGSHFPVPAVRFSTARRARPSQAWPLLQRPPAGLGLDRPSTVLRLEEAVTIIGTVLVEDLLSCGSDRRPSGPRPAPSGQAGLGRAAIACRVIERDPSPLWRGAAQRRAKLNTSTPAGNQYWGVRCTLNSWSAVFLRRGPPCARTPLATSHTPSRTTRRKGDERAGRDHHGA